MTIDDSKIEIEFIFVGRLNLKYRQTAKSYKLPKTMAK